MAEANIRRINGSYEGRAGLMFLERIPSLDKLILPEGSGVRVFGLTYAFRFTPSLSGKHAHEHYPKLYDVLMRLKGEQTQQSDEQETINPPTLDDAIRIITEECFGKLEIKKDGQREPRDKYLVEVSPSKGKNRPAVSIRENHEKGERRPHMHYHTVGDDQQILILLPPILDAYLQSMERGGNAHGYYSMVHPWEAGNAIELIQSLKPQQKGRKNLLEYLYIITKKV